MSRYFKKVQEQVFTIPVNGPKIVTVQADVYMAVENSTGCHNQMPQSGSLALSANDT